ncbi:PhzF family phenazine biosynthesis protein [Actinocorallia populi]|uniref:PhzF family phenazine biosynthesis protein n=1 Tax=Actinocorallia populi TaxID=2079200 RepID=UPI000D08C974|nr:PhzF family phenazine biosynthesis isomerase [Actinocorallia populi]
MRIFVVDAFTDQPFRGNPAGVCLLEGPAVAPSESWMQRVAAEMRHSETAFVRPLETGGFELRWFTPAVEVRLCGHATLATAHVLFTEGIVAGDEAAEFHTRSGLLTVRSTGRGLELDFPAVPAARMAEPPAGLAAGLGVEPEWVAHNAQNDVLAVVPDAATVRRLNPDLALLATIDARGVCVTAPAEDTATEDFVSRFFAPAVGIDEDPVTGSAHCMLAPYWAERLDRTALTGRQLSEREGLVGVAVRGDRVLLTGQAVTVLRGDLLV